MLLYSSIWAVLVIFMLQPIQKRDKKPKFSILTQNLSQVVAQEYPL